MKLFRGFIVAAAALGLASCGVTATDPPANASDRIEQPSTAHPVQAIGDAVLVRGYQSLIIAELTYQTVAQAALVATNAGLIRGELATRLRALNRTALAALEAGEKASSGAEKARQAAIVLGSVGGICKLGVAAPVCRAFGLR